MLVLLGGPRIERSAVFEVVLVERGDDAGIVLYVGGNVACSRWA